MSGSVASVRNVNGRGTGVAVPRDHHHEAALETLTEEPLTEEPLTEEPLPAPRG